MKGISCIKHGTIYKANPMDLVQWARNINPRNPHEQAYGQFIRVEVTEGEHAGESWMIDTWDIDSCCNALAYVRDMVEIDGHELWYYYGRAFYNSCVQLLPENVDLFEELSDLHDYELLSDRPDKDVSHYDPEDIVTQVWLAHEHKWPGGETLVRKDASTSIEHTAHTLFSKVQSEYMLHPVSYNFQYELRSFYKYALLHRDAACIQSYLPFVDDMARKSEMAAEIVKRDEIAVGQMSLEF